MLGQAAAMRCQKGAYSTRLNTACVTDHCRQFIMNSPNIVNAPRIWWTRQWERPWADCRASVTTCQLRPYQYFKRPAYSTLDFGDLHMHSQCVHWKATLSNCVVQLGTRWRTEGMRLLKPSGSRSIHSCNQGREKGSSSDCFSFFCCVEGYVSVALRLSRPLVIV